jgi:hypothetical protein
LGTISANGNYSAPAALPNPNTISLRATSTADANASASSSVTLLPMGMRLRLKAGFNVSGSSVKNQVILNALKKYGMIMADNGSNMYLSGAPDDRWDNNDLHALGQVKASHFEVLAASQVYTSSNIPQGSAPQITSFSASSTSVAAGTSVTLSWHVSGAS